MISLKNGAQIWVVGLDRPERIEGSPWDGGVLDEYGNMRANAWPEHIRPASYCQKLCMGLSCGGAILAFSIHEFDASNDLGELI